MDSGKTIAKMNGLNIRTLNENPNPKYDTWVIYEKFANMEHREKSLKLNHAMDKLLLVRCHACSGFGHFLNTCPSRKALQSMFFTGNMKALLKEAQRKAITQFETHPVNVPKQWKKSKSLKRKRSDVEDSPVGVARAHSHNKRLRLDAKRISANKGPQTVMIKTTGP